jgi:aminopeptidase N
MIAFLALHAALAADSLMSPGVSIELARYRAERVANVRYEIALDVTRRDTVLGNVLVSFIAKKSGDVILDFRGHWIGDVVVNGKSIVGRGKGKAVTSLPTLEFNGAHLRIPAQLLRDGANTLYMRFAAPIAPVGASVIRFTDDKDKRDYLYTLLVPSDANLLFPCFDQPDIKAVFRLRVTGPPGWKVLTNATDKPISTYLFAFAAGPWVSLSHSLSLSGTASATHMSLWVRQSRAHEVETDTIIAQNRRAKNWLADWFGVPYPFEKMDMLLAPAFPFGGMEHPGAIFYNEESFIYREPPTLVQRLGRQATINHEVAHQWFGDLTTMRWFDDLWMKEGFATYMSAKMQAAMGDSTAWMSFYLRNKPAAYDVDVTAGTTPVWQELANLDQAKSNYGAIVYNKAPGVLKQLEFLVGDSGFRAGVSSFLKAHAYGNATWRELLDHIGKAAGRDLTSWGQAFFVRPGMPIVEQSLSVSASGTIERLALIQRPAQPGVSGKGAWPMKVDVLLQYPDRQVILPVEMRAETTVVAAARGMSAPLFVYPNYNDHGYGLFMLDPRSAEYLLGATSYGLRVADDRQPATRNPPPFLRAMLWGSLWDLVRDARLDPLHYLDAAIQAVLAERDEQIVSRHLGRIGRVVRDYAMYQHIARDVDVMRPADVETLLLRGATDMSKSYGLRKMFLDTYVGIASTPAALARLDAWLDSTHAAGEPLRQPSRWSIVTQLASKDWPSASARLDAETRRDTTTAAKRRAFIAGAAFPRAEVKRAYFERYLRDSTLNEDWVTASLGAFNDADQSALTLPYLRPALDTLPWVQKNRRIFFLGRWLEGFVGGHRSPEALAIVDAFLAENPALPRDLRLKVLQVRDDLERTVRIRARRF